MKKKSKAASAVLALGRAVSAIGALLMYRDFFRRVHGAPETFSDYPEYPELQRRLAQERTDEVWDLTAFEAESAFLCRQSGQPCVCDSGPWLSQYLVFYAASGSSLYGAALSSADSGAARPWKERRRLYRIRFPRALRYASLYQHDL